MNKLKNGFYTALGTPLDKDGNIIAESLEKQIDMQIESGASGLLLMGSMGIEAYLKNSTYAATVQIAVNKVNGRVPLFIGAMDNSVAKVMEKIDLIGDRDIAGVVLTTPFYEPVNDIHAISWFTTIADKSQHPIYLYDLAVITKYKITLPVISELMHHPNIKGIKTADWEMIKAIERNYPNAKFECLYSGLDSFDYANIIGITKNLDGMFSCTPKNANKLFEYISKEDFVNARKHLDNILFLRDTMLENDLMVCFTYCMNLLGCIGDFHEDYCPSITDSAKTIIETVMKDIGEI